MTSCNELIDQLRDPSSTTVRVDWLSLVDSIPCDLPCTRHPLGFLHIELTSTASLRHGERLRLHYWPKTGSNADEIGTLHDHVWSLTSVVAAGSLRDRTFQPVPAPSGAFIGIRVFYEPGRSRFSQEGTFNLSFERELEIESDAIYRIPSRVVHDTAVVEAPAVTFVLAQDDHDASRRGPLVLHARDQTGSGTEVREPFDCAEVLSLVRKQLEMRIRMQTKPG